MKTTLVALVALALLAFAASAQAARYASPIGGGTGCSQGSPCTLEVAVEGAKSNEEVIVGAGVYPLVDELVLPESATGLYLHGDFAGSMPTLISPIIEYPVVYTSAEGTRIAWLDIRSTGKESQGIACASEGGQIDRVRVQASGDSSSAIGAGGTCGVSNSLAITSGDHSGAIGASGSGEEPPKTFRNVTAIATGLDSTGVSASILYEYAGTYRLNLVNTIASGTKADLLATGFEKPTGAGELVASFSNFDSQLTEHGGKIVDGGGNQTAAPSFVNAGAGDFQEATGSPTIDAGLVSAAVGTLDLAGNPRVLGGSVDIGAYEFMPPPPPAAVSAQVQSLAVSPAAFRPANLGEAIVSAKKRGKKAPVATTVKYSLSAAGTATFTVARKSSGRKAGKKCVKQTKANKTKKKCPLYKPVKGSFTHAGAAGANSFKFSGRVGGKALAPGSYVLTATAGASTKTAAFKIVK